MWLMSDPNLCPHAPIPPIPTVVQNWWTGGHCDVKWFWGWFFRTGNIWSTQWSWCVRAGVKTVSLIFGFLDLVLYALNFKMICFSRLASVISDYFRLEICDILLFSADWIGNVTKVRASKMPWKGPLFDQLRYRNDIAFQLFRCTQLLAESISLLYIYIYIGFKFIYTTVWQNIPYSNFFVRFPLQKPW